MVFSCHVIKHGEDRDRFFSWRWVITQKTLRLMGRRFSTVRKVKDWNKLLREVAESPLLEMCKTHLDVAT